eukprot:symbB.v1.2.019583.t1/scaffold1607.1/size111085/2
MEDRFQSLREEYGAGHHRQQEMQSEVKKDLSKMESRMELALQECRTRSKELEVSVTSALQSDMDSALHSALQKVEEVNHGNRALVERQEGQLRSMRSEVDLLRARLDAELDAAHLAHQHALVDWKKASVQNVDEVKMQLKAQVEELLHRCAGAETTSDVARRLATTTQKHLEEMTQKQEEAESRLQNKVQQVKRATESERLLYHEELTELKASLRNHAAEQREASIVASPVNPTHIALKESDKTARSEWEELSRSVAREARQREESMALCKERLEDLQKQREVQLHEAEMQLKHLASETTLTVQKSQLLHKDLEQSVQVRCQNHLDECQALTFEWSKAKEEVEVLVSTMQQEMKRSCGELASDVAFKLQKADLHFHETRRRAEEAQAAYDLAASAATVAETAQCAVEATCARNKGIGQEFQEAIERQCGEHMEFCNAMEATLKRQVQQQNTSFQEVQRR